MKVVVEINPRGEIEVRFVGAVRPGWLIAGDADGTSASGPYITLPDGQTPADLATAVLAALPRAERLAVLRAAAVADGYYVAELSHETMQRRFEEDAAER